MLRAAVMAHFVTEHSGNTLPALPVREGENVFVWFSRLGNQAADQLHLVDLAQSARGRGELSKELTRRLQRVPEVLKLSPTTRSQLR